MSFLEKEERLIAMDRLRHYFFGVVVGAIAAYQFRDLFNDSTFTIFVLVVFLIAALFDLYEYTKEKNNA